MSEERPNKKPINDTFYIQEDLMPLEGVAVINAMTPEGGYTAYFSYFGKPKDTDIIGMAETLKYSHTFALMSRDGRPDGDG